MTLPARLATVALVLVVVASVLTPGFATATQVSGAATSAQAATDADALAAVTNYSDSQVVVVRLDACRPTPSGLNSQCWTTLRPNPASPSSNRSGSLLLLSSEWTTLHSRPSTASYRRVRRFGQSTTTPKFAQVIGGMEWAVTQNADVLVFDGIAGGFQPILVEPVRNADAG